MPAQMRMPSHDPMFIAALAESCERTGALMKYAEKPSYEPGHMAIGVHWIAGDLVETTWTMAIWRMPHWSEGREVETVTIKRAADHVPGGPPVMRAEGRRGLDRLTRTVADLQRMDAAIRDAGETTEKPPLWAFGINRAALALARHEGFEFDQITTTQGSGVYRNPTGGTLRALSGAGKMMVWTRRFIVHVHEMKTEGSPRMIFRSSHGRLRNVITIPNHPVPETVLTAMSGLDLAQAIGHAAWPEHAGVRVTSAQVGREGTEPGALIMALSKDHEGLDDAPEGVKPWWRGKQT